MEWSDQAIVLRSRAHGESGAILELLTYQHGRHLGLVRGGSSRYVKPVLQPGNSLEVRWRARLEEHLGSFACELSRARAGALMDSGETLAGLNAFTAISSMAMAEREAHAEVFLGGEILLDAMMAHGIEHWLTLYVRWEVGLLQAAGFGLDLSACAATGSKADLAYVSPRTGRAVSRDGAGIYASRLFGLPGFLLANSGEEPTMADIAAGLGLTGHFLLERILRPQGKTLPPARLRLTGLVAPKPIAVDATTAESE